MQIKTEVKATINQIKQLIAEKYNISSDFDLEIMDEIVQVGNFVGKREVKPKDTPWYPDNSWEWVEIVPLSGKPTELNCDDVVEYLLHAERLNKEWKSFKKLAGGITWDFTNIVAYKKIK